MQGGLEPPASDITRVLPTKLLHPGNIYRRLRMIEPLMYSVRTTSICYGWTCIFPLSVIFGIRTERYFVSRCSHLHRSSPHQHHPLGLTVMQWNIHYVKVLFFVGGKGRS